MGFGEGEGREHPGARALRQPQRWLTGVAGLCSSASGAVAVFITDNELGSATLLVLGAVLLLMGVIGLVPKYFRLWGAEIGMDEGRLAAATQSAAVMVTGGLAERLVAYERKYEELRRQEPGPARTVALEGVLLQVRTLVGDPSLTAVMPRRVASFRDDSEGRRIVTLALLEYGDWLVTDVEVLASAISQPRSAFEQYHALKATIEAIPSLETEQRTLVRDAVLRFLVTPEAAAAGGRRRLAEQILRTIGLP